MKLSALVWRLVKLQRPPPEIAIFLPIRSACSSTVTLRPRLPASIAQKRAAAPPPITTTSESGTLEIVTPAGRHKKGGEPTGPPPSCCRVCAFATVSPRQALGRCKSAEPESLIPYRHKCHRR